MRNLKRECLTCPDRKQSLTKCFNECAYPVDILMDIELQRNIKAKKEKDNGATDRSR